ncbi:MAG TPA: hypothetical protein VFE46_13540 [Pirellulales bacterium]|nr:hypothetical protein [Pirellulales bacterium]
MKRFTCALLMAAALPLAACNQPGSQPSNPNPNPNPTPPPANKPNVDIQAPGVNVQSDKNGTTVKTPNTDVDVNKNK